MDKTFLYRKAKDRKSAYIYSEGSDQYKELTGKEFDPKTTNIMKGRKLGTDGKISIDFGEISNSGKNAAIKSLKNESP